MKRVLLVGLLLLPFVSGFGDNTTTVVAIPNGNQVVSSPTPVDAIVVDSNGNMSQQQVQYDPNAANGQGGVTINNNYGGDNASLFLPLFQMGFIWSMGYWVGHDGSYWNGHNTVYINNSHWDNHWNNYWHNNWGPKWQHYYNQHHNDPNFRYRDHGEDWHQNAGNWRGKANGGGFHGRAGERGGGARERGGGGHR
jgi:hypothetical protein